jgi:opine dehydrogenase
MAYDLSSRGYEVMLYEHPDFLKNIEGIIERGGIEAVETTPGNENGPKAALNGFAEVTSTADVRTAVEHADTLFMIMPSFGQEIVFKLVMPYLRDGQLLCLLPGNCGSLVFRRMMHEAGVRANVVFAETNTIPYACRIIESGRVFVLAVKQGMGIGALPGSESDRVAEDLAPILNLKLYPHRNVAQIALNNPNMVVHPGTSVLNMGVSESRKGGFFFYREGMSESVCKVLQAIDDERMNVTEGLGLGRESFFEHTRQYYDFNYKTIREFAECSPIHSSFGYDAPTSPRNRYVSEDCPFLLVPVYEFGRLLGIRTPVTESLITIASVYNDTNYFQTGRTLAKLGLGGMSKEQILETLE